MRAVALDFESRSVEQISAAPPELLRAGEVLLRLRAAGVCGTDRDLAAFHFGTPPQGETKLILGHEALAEVVEPGASSLFRRGDLVVPMIRRACAPGCASCRRDRRDLCISGQYTERGITGAHGYFTEYAVDLERDLFRVPEGLAEVAVLAEPLSVVEKAASVAMQLHQGEPGSAAVLGAGTIGLLAALVLRERGLDVTVCSREDDASLRARLVRAAGFRYEVEKRPNVDIVIEAAGSPEAGSIGVQMLAPLGVMVVLGAPESRGPVPLLDLIVGNRVIAGSVNAGPEHWRAGLEHLLRFDRHTLLGMIHREPFGTWRDSLFGPPRAHPKVVHMID